MPDQHFDQARRVLAVAVHEQHGAEPGVVEAGKQRRLLTEVARERKHLHVEDVGRQVARDRRGRIAAAVVDVDDLDMERARRLEPRHRLGDARVQPREPGRFVVHRHHDGKPRRLRPRRRGVRTRRGRIHAVFYSAKPRECPDPGPTDPGPPAVSRHRRRGSAHRREHARA